MLKSLTVLVLNRRPLSEWTDFDTNWIKKSKITVLKRQPLSLETNMLMMIVTTKGDRLVFYHCKHTTWWRHQMETFSALLAICAWNSPVPGEFPAQRPVTQSFNVFFHLGLNKRLSKQSWAWWFGTLSRSLWRHRNERTEITCILLAISAPKFLLPVDWRRWSSECTSDVVFWILHFHGDYHVDA